MSSAPHQQRTDQAMAAAAEAHAQVAAITAAAYFDMAAAAASPAMAANVAHLERLATASDRGSNTGLRSCQHVSYDRPTVTCWAPAEPLLLQCRRCIAAWDKSNAPRPCDGCSTSDGHAERLVFRAWGFTIVCALLCYECINQEQPA